MITKDWLDHSYRLRQVNLLVPLIGWCSLLMRMSFNFVKLAKYTRRPVPHKPNTADSTGGYRPWLEAQIFLSTMVTNLLFCLSTGQLEAWWALYDRDACQPPTLERTAWKYPNCDTRFVSEGMSYDSSDLLYDESSSEQAVETVDPSIMASNATCWQQQMPELNSDCPFVQAITNESLAEWRAKSQRTSTQSLHRLVVFVVLQNLQVILLYVMNKWNHAKDGDTEDKWRAARLAQHSLVADQIFPPEASDQIYSVVAATLARGRMKQHMDHVRANLTSSTSARDRPVARLSIANDDGYGQDGDLDAIHRQALARAGHSVSSRRLVIPANMAHAHAQSPIELHDRPHVNLDDPEQVDLPGSTAVSPTTLRPTTFRLP